MSEKAQRILGSFARPIPEPHLQVKRFMLATAMLIDGYLDTEPQHLHPHLQNCFLAPKAGVIIAGTRCPRPLMTREIVSVGATIGRDAIVVRLGDERQTTNVSFDVHPMGGEFRLLAYRLWMPQPSGAPWLVPTAGETTFVRLDPHGLDLSGEPPFASDFDRHRGLVWASEFLSVATKGWF